MGDQPDAASLLQFNSKFPRAMDDDPSHQHAKKGFLDPSRRTERVFRVGLAPITHDTHIYNTSANSIRTTSLR